MLRLGVNVDHSATLRQARYPDGIGEPDPVAFALRCETAGAHGITAHLREDRRHIQDRDLWALREQLTIGLNFEMANTEEMIGIAEKLRPQCACIVPEKREELTTEGGLDVRASVGPLRRACERLQAAGITVSLFVDAEIDQIDASAETGAEFVELHTGPYAEAWTASPERRIEEARRLAEAAARAQSNGIAVNLGHGLNYENVKDVLVFPGIYELNIGHSIVSRALFSGVDTAVKDMLVAMQDYQPGSSTLQTG